MPWESPETIAQAILLRLKKKDFRSEYEFTNYLVSKIRQAQVEVRDACEAFFISQGSGEGLIRALRENVALEPLEQPHRQQEDREDREDEEDDDDEEPRVLNLQTDGSR